MKNPPGKHRLVSALKGSPIFKGIGRKQLENEFLPAMELKGFVKQVDRDCFLTDRFFYVIVQGMVHGFRKDLVKGRRTSMFVLKAGDGFDVITLLDNRSHRVSFTCLEREVICLVAPCPVMRKWIRQEPEISKALLTYMADLLLKLEELVFDLSVCDTGTRLVKLLLEQAQMSLQDGKGPAVLHHLTHEELASLIGSVRVVVSRQVQKLKKSGLIDLEKGKVIIRDLETLLGKIEYKVKK